MPVNDDETCLLGNDGVVIVGRSVGREAVLVLGDGLLRDEEVGCVCGRQLPPVLLGRRGQPEQLGGVPQQRHRRAEGERAGC